jgi:peptide/nickel transport system substrate-binding protein
MIRSLPSAARPSRPDERNGSGSLLPDGRTLQIVVETAGEETEQTDVLELVRDDWRKVGMAFS